MLCDVKMLTIFSYVQLGTCFAICSVIFARPHTSGIAGADIQTYLKSSLAHSGTKHNAYVNLPLNDTIHNNSAPKELYGINNKNVGLLATGQSLQPKEMVDTLYKKEFGSNGKDIKDRESKLLLPAVKNSSNPFQEQNRGKVRATKVNQSSRSIPLLNMSTASEKVSHTTTTSLIAALVFGVVFLIAVAVQIGKPWWESLLTNRDGYNRITFLMNGK